MNAPIEDLIGQVRLPRDARNEVHRWRGCCLDRFARLEQSLSNALASCGCEVPQSLSLRLDATRQNLLARIPAGHPSNKLDRAVEAVHELVETRNAIAHAHGDILINERGQWVWTYSHSPGGGRPDVRGFITEAEASDFVKNASRACQRLGDLLANIKPEPSR